MKRKIIPCMVIASMTILTLNISYAGWGKEEWYRTIATVPCSFSSNSELAVGGSYGPSQLSFTGATAHGGSVVYAHYAARKKNVKAGEVAAVVLVQSILRTIYQYSPVRIDRGKELLHLSSCQGSGAFY